MATFRAIVNRAAAAAVSYLNGTCAARGAAGRADGQHVRERRAVGNAESAPHPPAALRRPFADPSPPSRQAENVAKSPARVDALARDNNNKRSASSS